MIAEVFMGLANRLQAIEDELAIRNLVARFTDSVNERDSGRFRSLCANDATWEICAPLPAKVVGLDAIVALLQQLLGAKPMFMQMTHSGVIEMTGKDTAVGRFTERERGRGRDDFYENLAIYHEEYVRTFEGWRFKTRRYEYRYLDTSTFAGQIFPLNVDRQDHQTPATAEHPRG